MQTMPKYSCIYMDTSRRFRNISGDFLLCLYDFWFCVFLFIEHVLNYQMIFKYEYLESQEMWRCGLIIYVGCFAVKILDY